MDLSCEVNNIELPRVETVVACGLNRSVYSSMLFMLPIIYSYKMLPYSNIMFGSIACLCTSLLYHYHNTKNTYFRIIDILTVNSAALYFTLHCFMKIGNKFYANITYLFAIVTLCTHYYINYRTPHLGLEYHFIIHILSITGIMFYIKARTTYLTPPVVVEDPELKGEEES
jgi:hypothetical protein